MRAAAPAGHRRAAVMLDRTVPLPLWLFALLLAGDVGGARPVAAAGGARVVPAVPVVLGDGAVA